jgi:sterol desaturase/sphingolipid hydroxylase (fatty acid hydroxylase superfamily)
MSGEPAVRLAFFLGVLAAMSVWQWLAPRRRPVASSGLRWLSNVGILVLSTLVLRFLLPASAAGVAIFAADHGWGLFNHLAAPGWLAVVLSVIALDLAIYVQHVLFHAIPALWRLHRVHHADLDFDVTTGVRFHPIEILLSMGIKIAAIAALGAPALAVVIFEVLLNGTSMFNHGNVRLPLGADRALRLLVVTPDMHRVHHSITAHETNSNFGFALPWWDRLLGTYKDQPDAGHEAMTIGIDDFRDERQVDRLPGMLALPFRGPASAYTINRRHWRG